MAEIVISEFMDEATVEALSASYDTLYNPQLFGRLEDLSAACSQAAALIVRNCTQVRRPLLDTARHLRVVGRLGVGLDNIDLEACRSRGIAVCPATGANDQAVAEYVVATVMMLIRGCYRASDRVASGSWPRRALCGGEIAGKRLGLIGFGRTARAVAQRLSALGMKVSAYDPLLADNDDGWRRAERKDLAELLAESDAVSLHVPWSEQTRDLLDAQRIAGMKASAVLVNTSRGGVVDETALVAALLDGRLGGAALDVFEGEPLSRDDGQKFVGVPNLILTPHIAGITFESNVRVSQVTAENVRRVLDQNRLPG